MLHITNIGHKVAGITSISIKYNLCLFEIISALAAETMYNLLTRNSAIFKKLFRTNQRCFITNATMNKIDEKLKGTIFENWLRFWKNVHHDYREMIKEAHNDIMEKPVKAFLYFLGCTFVGCCASFNPNEANFRSKYIE